MPESHQDIDTGIVAPSKRSTPICLTGAKHLYTLPPHLIVRKKRHGVSLFFYNVALIATGRIERSGRSPCCCGSTLRLPLLLWRSMPCPPSREEQTTPRGQLNQQRHTTMKKVLTVVAIVAVLACLGGCKKKCNCVTTMNGQVVQTTTVESTNCAKLNVSQNVGGMVQEMKCD